MWNPFNKKIKGNLVNETQRQNELSDMELAVQKAKTIRMFFDELLSGCTNEEELKERISMAKGNNPDLFLEYNELIAAELTKRKLGTMKELIEVAKGVDDSTMKNLENFKKLGKTQNELEFKK